MSKKSIAAHTALTAFAVSTALVALVAGVGAGPAQATVVPQVRIYLENDNHNPGTVTVDCAADGVAQVHTALFNDAVGANVVETAVIYSEPANPASGLGTIVYGPVDVPIGGHVNVVVPVHAGVTFDAVAVAKGDPLPTSIPDLVARLQASPATADNSQLLPSGYPALPVCAAPSTPSSHPSSAPSSKPPCDGAEPVDRILAQTPSPCPRSVPSSRSSSSASAPKSSGTSAATTDAGRSGSSSASPSTVPTPTASTPVATGTGPATAPLAHTGTSVLPVAAGAGALLLAGGGIALYSRRVRRSH